MRVSSDYPSVHELKFVINNNKSHQVIEWLKSICKPDNEYSSGCVSSIYYDTRNWSFLGEKINSDYLKTKVRVRWYSDIDYKDHSENSFAEAKFKIGSRRDKIRIKTPFPGEWLCHTQLENQNLIEIPKTLRSIGFVPDQTLYPVFQISYKRMRFIDPFTNSRVCFDYDISAPRVNWFMLPKHNPFILQSAVFEIKGKNSELPFNLHPLTDFGCRKMSFSKFSACYQKIKGVPF
ncbi:MAG: VTC domain-containing protein [Spirochaetota bacterium]|nr:VTC domain-containing protein [Spirochaetota bacterium]